MGEDYYSLLGINKNATEEEINKAYRSLSKKYHPDKNLNDKEKAEEMFKKINHAKNILLDPEKRKVYDQYGEEGIKEGMGMGDRMGQEFFSNIFNGMFGGFNFFNQKEEKKKPQQVIVIKLTLEDVFKGFKTTKKFNIQIHCEKCESTGKEEVEICENCKGAGFCNSIRQIGPGIITQSRTECRVCNTKGKKGKGNDCETCQGKGTISKTINIEVTFRKGVNENEHFKVEREGVEFIFVSKIENHPVFQREGNNLVLIKEISLFEALNKVNFEVEMLDGEKIKIQSKEGEVIVPSKSYLIPTLGLNMQSSLKIFFKVKFPEKINKDGKDIYEIFKEERIEEEKKEEIEIYYI